MGGMSEQEQIEAAITASMGISAHISTATPAASAASTTTSASSSTATFTATLTSSQRSMASQVVSILGGMGATEQQCIDALRAHGWQSDRATDWLINELMGA